MTEKSIAIVGTPCEIMAASKLQHYTQSPINFKIGLFCMENFSYSYFEKLLKEYDIKMSDVKKFRIEKGKAFIFLQDDQEIKIPLSVIKPVVRKNCDICVELTSDNSDISIGSIGSDSGYSTVIIRTEKGEEVIKDAIHKGYIETKELTEFQLNLLNKIASNKKNNGLENIDERESRSKPVLYQREISDNMIFDEITVSNFSDLKANVIDVGACVLCGACEYACPDNLIIIDDTKPRIKGKCPENCHFCFAVCPRTFAPENLKNDNLKDLGDYKSIMTIKSLKNYDGQDGGVVTTVLDYLISNNKVDEAIVVDKKDNSPWKPVAKLTSDIDEIIKASGTKYSVCPVFKPLNQAKKDVI